MSTSAKRRTPATSPTARTTNSALTTSATTCGPAARGDERYPKHCSSRKGRLHFAIIDEVDNILIDEARTPLIISGPAHDNVRKYAEPTASLGNSKRDVHFEVNEKDHNAHLTDEGVREAEKLAGVESFYTAGNMEWPQLIDNSLKAHHIYKRDVNYVVKDGAIVIVDEFTGRLMEGRQWSDGLHQAVEAKENVKIKEETQTLATITLQNFFKLYEKLAGMTGTAMTEADEFWKIYKLDVYAIPTNRPLQRLEYPDLIYTKEAEKYKALARRHRTSAPLGRARQEGRQRRMGRDQERTKRSRSNSSRRIKARSHGATVRVRAHRSQRPTGARRHDVDRKERTAWPTCSTSAVSNTRCSTPNSTNAKRKLSLKPVEKGGDDCHQHGGPWYRHRARRQSRNPGWAQLQDKYETRLDVPREEWDALVAEIETNTT